MPYCPKCGVETETHIQNCPLCDFPIPDIRGEEKTDYDQVKPIRFPRPENIMTGKMIDIKRSTFYALTLFILLNLIRFIASRILTGKPLIFTIIVCAFTACLWFYLFNFFGFVKNKRILITGLITNTFFFTFLLDIFNGLNWFIIIFVPCTILASTILIVFAVFIRYQKKRVTNLIFPTAIALSLFFIGVQSIIGIAYTGSIKLTWSLDLSGECLLLALLLLFFYHKIPAWIVIKLKKKLHM